MTKSAMNCTSAFCQIFKGNHYDSILYSVLPGLLNLTTLLLEYQEISWKRDHFITIWTLCTKYQRLKVNLARSVMHSVQLIVISPTNRNWNRIVEPTSEPIGMALFCEFQNQAIGRGIVCVNNSQIPEILFLSFFIISCL